MPQLTFVVTDSAGNQTPLIFTADVPTGAWPANGTWAEKEAWIQGQAGVKATNLPVVGVNGVPPGCTWVSSSKTLNVPGSVGLIEGWNIPGRIYVKDHTGVNLILRNIRGQDVFNEKLSGQPAAARVSLVEDCDFNLPSSIVVGGWGQGALNAMRPGFIVRRSILRGAADGMQCAGGGLIEASVIRDLTVSGVAPAGTHNDTVQNYGGLVSFRKVYSVQNLVAGQESHLNGVFCSESNATFDIEDCSLNVTAPAGMNGFVLHAGKGGISGIRIDVRNSKIRGRTVGNVVFGAGVDYAAGY